MSTAESTIVAPVPTPTFVVRKWQSNLTHLVVMMANAAFGNIPAAEDKEGPMPGILLSFEIEVIGLETANNYRPMSRPLARFYISICNHRFDCQLFTLNYLYVGKPDGKWEDAPAEDWRQLTFFYDENTNENLDKIAEAYLLEAAKLVDLSTMTFSGVKLHIKPQEWQDATVHLNMDVLESGVTHVTMRKNIFEREGAKVRYRYEIIPPPEQPEGQG